ncbi:hypothetical protein ACFFW8_26485 [Erwinia tracheiphila]
MKKMLILPVSVMLAGLSFPALADNVDFGSISDAAVRSSDLSRQLLIMMFGDVVSNPLQPTNTSFIGGLSACLTALSPGWPLSGLWPSCCARWYSPATGARSSAAVIR